MHEEILKIFNEFFPGMPYRNWWKKGPNAVRLRTGIGLDLVFTYLSVTEWKLETIKIHELSKDGI